MLGWYADGCRVEFPVELVDISLHGCRVMSRRRAIPKPGQPVWLKPAGAGSPAWIAATLVSSVRPFLRKRSTRIRFLDCLRYQTFKMLVYGPDGIDLERIERPEHETDTLWR